MLGSRKGKERAAGARALVRIAADDSLNLKNNRMLYEYQEAVVAAGGIPLLVRALGAADVDAAHDAAYVVFVLAAYSSDNHTAIAVAGGIPPLIALLRSPSVDVQKQAAGALGILSNNVENRVTIASAGGIPPLVALLASPSVDVRDAAARALDRLGVDH
jgi:hypothetical protein